MERYTLIELYANKSLLEDDLNNWLSDSDMIMGLTEEDFGEVSSFISACIFGYFYPCLVAYADEDKSAVRTTLIDRMGYDIAVKLPYWYRKYNQIKKLLTTEDLSLLQTSKVVSSSRDNTASASGSLQKTATTPTGVNVGGTIDNIDITNTIDVNKDSSAEVETTGFADKYTNAQQKFASANNVKGERSGTITREGSIDDLLNVLEKLPSSFADEVTRDLQKHFIFDFDGEERGIYETD
jgi:hypothetical protein